MNAKKRREGDAPNLVVRKRPTSRETVSEGSGFRP